MPELYYLFSESNRLESLYVCDHGAYIDNPTYQTAVYPMGTLLSKSIRMLAPWAESNFNFLEKQEKFSTEKLVQEFSMPDSSFSNVVCDDLFARLIMLDLLGGNFFEKESHHHY